eukprot:SAG25_NODE_11273_length_308_cov_39.732057_1_plen_29_part_10
MGVSQTANVGGSSGAAAARAGGARARGGG